MFRSDRERAGAFWAVTVPVVTAVRRERARAFEDDESHERTNLQR